MSRHKMRDPWPGGEPMGFDPKRRVEFNKYSPLITGYILHNTFMGLGMPSPIKPGPKTLVDDLRSWGDVKGVFARLNGQQRNFALGFSMALATMSAGEYQSEGTKVANILLETVGQKSSPGKIIQVQAPKDVSPDLFSAGEANILGQIGENLTLSWMRGEMPANPLSGVFSQAQLFEKLGTLGSETLNYMRGFAHFVEIRGNTEQKRLSSLLISYCMTVLEAREKKE